MAGGVADRSALWLPLLRRLTVAAPSWLVWKNAGSALHGIGDVDSVARQEEWVVIEEEFRSWAGSNALGPIAACRHIPGGLNLIAMPAGMTTFLEMSVKHDKAFRGSHLFDVDGLQDFGELDDLGFRRLRPGAEGLLKLVLNGSRRGGRSDPDGLRGKHVAELLRADPEGVRLASRVFGCSAAPARRLAVRVADGEWDRPAMLLVEGRALLRSLARPAALTRRLWFRAATSRRCPIVEAILTQGRRMPDDRRTWLAAVAREHTLELTGD